MQTQQVPKRDQQTYGSYRRSHNLCSNRDADVDSNRLWEQEQVLSILERRPRGTEASTGRETREQTHARVEQVGISHNVYGHRVVDVDACIGRTQVEALLDTEATTDLIQTDVARDLMESSEIKPCRGRLETSEVQEKKVDG